MKEQRRINEFGRTLTETLAMLAIVGILSVIGLWMYNAALDSHKANTIVSAVNRRATVLAANKNFGTGFTPSETFGSDTSYTITCEDKKNTDLFTCTVKTVPQEVCQKVLALGWKMPTIILPTTCSEVNDILSEITRQW